MPCRAGYLPDQPQFNAREEVTQETAPARARPTRHLEGRSQFTTWHKIAVRIAPN
ncbi:MAG: hypothetical protein IPM31_17985 [Anaerolineae bacterium]|nr:hypothetical protein [Anaerolineae bacterium]